MGLLSDALDVVYPPLCLACDAPVSGGHFCATCELSVQRLEPDGCEVCSEPGHHLTGRCERCRNRRKAFERAFAPYVHDGALAKAIHRFKYEDKPELARPLGEMLASAAKDFISAVPSVVTPVPLHESRYRERKYDHAMLLAVTLAKHAGLTLVDSALTRVRDTPRQVGLTDEQRVSNVRDAFSAGASAKGQSLLLIDDVLTTGATAHAAAITLLAAGATKVRVLTLARAVLRQT
jgi:ComF family protein